MSFENLFNRDIRDKLRDVFVDTFSLTLQQGEDRACYRLVGETGERLVEPYVPPGVYDYFYTGQWMIGTQFSGQMKLG